MQERKAALDTPIAEDSPDLGNTVQGDVSGIQELDMSIFSPAESSGLKAIRNLITTGQNARFRSDSLNQDVIMPIDSSGRLKAPNNPNSRIIEAHGLVHIITMHMAHGESMDEAAYTCAKAVMAAINGEKLKESEDGLIAYLRLDAYKAVVSLQWNGKEKTWMITGYKEDGKHSSADARRKAFDLSKRYAFDTFAGRKQMGAALDYAISRLAREYKQNNADPNRKLRKNYSNSQLSTFYFQNQTSSDFSITARERIEQNRDAFRNDPSFGLGQLGTFESIMLVYLLRLTRRQYGHKQHQSS
ncbi:MAG: hypothetical protein IKV92_05300 [Akkermansia sp.]|nr:hypothetical protein [Akkermansia sp.]